MAEITTLFWDIGGVLLSNGWDPGQRRRAVEEFALDPGEFEARHEVLLGVGIIGLAAVLVAGAVVTAVVIPFQKKAPGCTSQYGLGCAGDGR